MAATTAFLLEGLPVGFVSALSMRLAVASTAWCIGCDQALRIAVAAARIEGGLMRSATLRREFIARRGAVLGAWSFCDGRSLREIPPRVVIGRYCSIGPRVLIANQNHPIARLSSSAAFYDPAMGFVGTQTLAPRGVTVIGHDVWIGANASILPGCRKIGHGAVIGAGAVVTHDVPALAIVVGNPARVIGERYSESIGRQWLGSRWWTLAPQEICDVGARDDCDATVLRTLAERSASHRRSHAVRESEEKYEALFA
ncbi:MAG: CatB-related O-acetyltransferase [Planctomycetota bacterium]